MNTFEITIQRKNGDGWPVIAEQNQPGRFLPVRSEGLLTIEPERLLAHLDPVQYGAELGQALFDNGIRDGFTRALADSRNNLRVLLFVEADDLRSLRWERLCAPLNNRWSALARNAQALYSLYLPSVTDSRFPAIGRRDLRALVVVASPAGLERYNLPPFDLPAALENITTAPGDIPFDILVSGAAKNDQSVIKPAGPASLDALCDQLTQERYTLLHVVAHGMFSKRTGEVALLLANSHDQAARVTTAELIDRLRKLRGARGLPHLTFLATCDGATPEADGALGNVGQALVRDLGMPAAIAMLEKAPAAAMQTLTHTFYSQLHQHGEVDRALVAAGAGLPTVAAPVLYSRLGGRPLFSDQLAHDRPLTNAEIQFGIEQLGQLLPARAPVLTNHYAELAAQLRATLGAEIDALDATLRTERAAALDALDALCSEVLDINFNVLALGQEPPLYDDRCPYLGLAAFHAENSSFFFGREPLTARLLQRLQEHNFLAVLGGSGSGKSSLVLAGLVPTLQAQQPNLTVHYFTPTSDPVGQLTRTLNQGLQNEHQLIVVDQFEELFTLCPNPTHRQQFLDRLLGLLNDSTRAPIHHSPFTIHHLQFSLTLTMRADFWGECAVYPKLRDLMQAHQELVGPMTAQELRSSMEQQARVVGLRFETNLSNTILDDVAGEPGAMPLLQHALLELWKRRRGRWLRAAEYRALGGVQQAIARTADSIYNALDDEDRERMRAIFLRLTRLDEGDQTDESQRDTRRRARFEELAADGDEAATHNLVQRLADARLVVISVREGGPPSLTSPYRGGTDPSSTSPLLPPLRREGRGGVQDSAPPSPSPQPPPSKGRAGEGSTQGSKSK
ncbi:MAG: CHAT domain-containing protein [Caldilineaceae bacterium]